MPVTKNKYISEIKGFCELVRRLKVSETFESDPLERKMFKASQMILLCKQYCPERDAENLPPADAMLLS